MLHPFRFILPLLILLPLLSIRPAQAQTCQNWFVSSVSVESRTEWRIHYGIGLNSPQHAALHDDGYFRLAPGPLSGWGTSVITLPSYWSGGTYYQGGTIQNFTSNVNNCTLELSYDGTVGVLKASVVITLDPPVFDLIRAQVAVTVQNPGAVTLDTRAGEAFKPIMLSSMHVSTTEWDTRLAYVDNQTYPIPASSWIVEPVQSVVSQRFGLLGGTSSWKMNAPTINIVIDAPRQIAGWVTSSSNPNDDNVGFWCATDTVLTSWTTIVIASLENSTVGIFRPSTATHYLRHWNTTGPADINFVFGNSTDLPVAGDWNGDHWDTVGLYRKTTGVFFLKNANTQAAPIVYQFQFGGSNDLPLAGDWDGDGKDGIGIYRPTTGQIFLRNALSAGPANYSMTFGEPGDNPLAGDWDGDGTDSPGMYRPTNSRFYLPYQGCASCIPAVGSSFVFGAPGDSGFAGDWDGDGKDGVAVFHPTNGVIYLKNELATGNADTSLAFGAPGDVPFSGNWSSGILELAAAPQRALIFVPR